MLLSAGGVLADVMLLCPVCQGKRFNTDVLSVKHAGKTVADVLALTVDQAIATFSPKHQRDYVIENTLRDGPRAVLP